MSFQEWKKEVTNIYIIVNLNTLYILKAADFLALCQKYTGSCLITGQQTCSCDERNRQDQFCSKDGILMLPRNEELSHFQHYCFCMTSELLKQHPIKHPGAQESSGHNIYRVGDVDIYTSLRKLAAWHRCRVVLNTLYTVTLSWSKSDLITGPMIEV